MVVLANRSGGDREEKGLENRGRGWFFCNIGF